jgi:hypothetical protein
LIELNNGIITGIEIKLSPSKKTKKPPAFDKIYPEADFKLISRENYLDFIMP